MQCMYNMLKITASKQASGRGLSGGGLFFTVTVAIQ